jgi:hypothetical protein
MWFEAFIESELEVPRHLARQVHDLYRPTHPEFEPRTLWSLSNRAMHHPLARNPATPHDAEVAVFFAVLLTPMNFQMHVVGRMPHFG